MKNLILRLVTWWLARHGLAVMSVEVVNEYRALANRTYRYVHRSGHLAGMKRQRPRAVKRVLRALNTLAGGAR